MSKPGTWGGKLSNETKKDILEEIKNVKMALDNRDINALLGWSDRTIHCATIYQDQRAIYVAILTYSLAKLIEKQKIQERYEEEWEDFMRGISENIEATTKFLESGDIRRFEESLRSMLKTIMEFDKSFSEYVQHVLDFAKIQKGEKLYAHGLSLSSVAQLLGISKWELMPKVGETTTHDHELFVTKTVKERLEEAKSLFKRKKS